MTTPRPQPGEPRNRYVYYPDTAEVPESVAVNVRRRSYTIAAGVDARRRRRRGRAVRPGGVAGGHALYLQDGHLHYVYNWLGERLQKVSAAGRSSPGTHVLTAEFPRPATTRRRTARTGTLTLYVDDERGRASARS